MQKINKLTGQLAEFCINNKNMVEKMRKKLCFCSKYKRFALDF